MKTDGTSFEVTRSLIREVIERMEALAKDTNELLERFERRTVSR